MELANLSLTELRRLQSKVDTEIRRRSDVARRDLLKRMQKMAAEEGLSLTDVLGAQATNGTEKRAAPKRGRKAAAKPAASAAKYRHPTNAEIGWSGRGRKPQWVLDWVAEGKSIDELAVR